jgi:hypothetical protein
MGNQRAVDRLYGLPLGEFTAARNALVRELQKAGAKDHAEEVRNLRKPAASAWAVNQLARRHPQQIRELIEAGTVLRKAQRDALAGKKADVREAARAQHALVDDLVDTAREILAEAGVRATTAAAQRISSTLRAASSDPAAAKHLRAGRLRDDVEAVGFGPLLHVAPNRAEGGRNAVRLGRRALSKKRSWQLPGNACVTSARLWPRRSKQRQRPGRRLPGPSAKSSVHRRACRLRSGAPPLSVRGAEAIR